MHESHESLTAVYATSPSGTTPLGFGHFLFLEVRDTYALKCSALGIEEEANTFIVSIQHFSL